MTGVHSLGVHSRIRPTRLSRRTVARSYFFAVGRYQMAIRAARPGQHTIVSHKSRNGNYPTLEHKVIMTMDQVFSFAG